MIQRKPYTAVYFEKIPPLPLSKEDEDNEASYFLRDSDNFGPAVFFKTKGRSVQLSSRYDPEKEIRQILPQGEIKWAKTEIVLIFGLGSLGLLSAVLPHLQENQICIGVDASLELGQLLCQQSSIMQEFLLRPGCHLFCGPRLEQSLRQYMESLPIDRFSGIKLLRHPPSVRLNSAYYAKTESDVRSLIKARISDLLTRLEFEGLWVKNILLNTCYLPEKTHPQASSYTVKKYKNSLQAKPGVLIASGPSLQESFAELRVLKDKAFLLCVDTALKVLLSGGIVPHGVITLDAQPHTFFAFCGIDLSDIILFADLASNPAVLRKIKIGKTVFSTTAQTSFDYTGSLRQEFTRGTEYAQEIHGEIGCLQSGGSVAASGLDLLRVLGCDPIMLIGLDHAYTDRKIHSSGSYHTKRWLTNLVRTKTTAGIIENIVRKRQTFLVPAIDGNSILSDYVLDLYKKWFDDSIPNCSEKIYQLTRRGALLKSALSVSDPLAFAKSLPFQKELTAPFANTPQLSRFVHPALQDIVSHLQRALEKKLDIPTLCRRFSFLQFASRRAELYIKRNPDKLSSAEADSMLCEKTLAILKRLDHSLQHSLQHSLRTCSDELL